MSDDPAFDQDRDPDLDRLPRGDSCDGEFDRSDMDGDHCRDGAAESFGDDE